MMEKRELFSSLASRVRGVTSERAPKKQTLRPPYGSDDSLFHKLCPECDAPCVTVCEEEIIVIMDDKTPQLNLLKSGCTYCDKCAEACLPEVLKVEDTHNINAKITIDKNKCMSWHGVMCFSCKEPCLDDAIVFKSLFKPVIVADKCTSCGFCIGRCPSDAIEVEVV